MAYERVNGFSPQFAEQFGMRVFFRYTPGDYDSDGEIAITELLRREAQRMGVGISTAGVFEFIRSLGGSSKTLTKEQFAEIRDRLRVGEQELIDVLARELQARRAYDLLYSQRPLPTPESLYEAYEKLNLQQEAEIAVLPVSDFVDPDAKPTQADLEDLFAKHKSNVPGFGSDNRPVEGQPGFLQPPRMRLAYLEAEYDTFEKLVPEITDKEVEARYEELKKRPLNDPGEAPNFGDLPGLPGGGLDSLKGLMTPQPGSVPAAPAAPPSAEGAKPELSAPAAPPAPMPEAPKAETPTGDAPKTETKTPDLPKLESSNATPAPPAAPPAAPPSPAAATPETPAPAPPANPSSQRLNPGRLSFVSFQEEERPPAPPVATGTAAPQAEKPAGEKLATEKPADSAPPKDSALPGSAPALPPPAPPTAESVAPPADPPLPTVRALDDAYRKELRDEIRRERTLELMEKKMAEVAQWTAEEIGALVKTPETDKAHLTPETAAKKLKEYAEKNKLVYVETPFLSFQELEESEDYPIGTAAATSNPQRANVVQDAFQSFGRSMTYLPRPAVSFDQQDGSHFVYWILEEKNDFEPKDMSDPIVKAQVEKAWREQKARAKAEERATALVKMAKEAAKPLQEAFAEQSVTGKTGTGFITVRPTGKFTWFRAPVVPTRSMQREAPVTVTELPGLKPLGDSFFTKVFEEMKVGDVAVANSADKSEFYVVKIVSRTPSTPEELETFRQAFISRGMNNEYFDLTGREWARYGINPINELIKSHNVQFLTRERESADAG